ncbi:DUF6701 domain-containing protein [Methylomonas sp. AM2-LC]|uniref:DUF6701 domain-containing protein n=1 Tax=Methylomonas sp. AM2-LC TaxID=3153301 RepID=UPI00326646C8
MSSFKALANITYISESSGYNGALPTDGSPGALVINKPPGTVAGQTLIASIVARPYTVTYTAPPGWTLMTSTQQPNGGTSTAPGGITLLTYYNIVGINDPNSYTWTFSNSHLSGGTAVGGFLAFSGVDTTASPINVWSAQLNPSSMTQSTASITTTVANSMIISSLTYLSASSFGTPTGISGMVGRLDQSAPLAANAVGTTIQMATATKANAGATGSATAVATGDSSFADYGVGQLMALTPSQVDTAVTITRSGNLIAGSSASYTLNVSNFGLKSEPGPLTIVDTLSSSLSYAAYSGSGWSCSASGKTVICTRTGAIASGGSASALVLYVNVSSSAAGTVTNTATVSGTGGDQNTVNNTAIDSYQFPSEIYAYYAMEESTWGNIQDYSGNGRSASALGTATPTAGAIPNSPYSAITGNPGTCGAGQVPAGTTAMGVNTGIDVNSLGNTGTIAFWYTDNENWNNGKNRILFDASNLVGSYSNHFFLAKNNVGALVFSISDTAYTVSTATSPSYNFSANTWHYIAVTWDLSVNQTAIYLDGNTLPIATSTSVLNGSLGDMATLYVGAQRMSGITGSVSAYTSNTANGDIDELRLYQGALSATELSSLETQTHACVSVVANLPPPYAFNCIETGQDALSGHLYTKLINTAFAFDVVALNDANNDGVADSVDNNYASNGSKAVTLELVDGTGNASCAQRTAISPAVNQTLIFSQVGQLTAQGRLRSALMSVTAAYPNLMCRVTDANQTPNVVGCSTDRFSVRPVSFTVTGSVNADATGVSTTATPTIKAGSQFSLTASTSATGYNAVPLIDNSKITAHTGATQAGTLSGSFSAATANSGTATGAAFSYSEVGYFSFAADGVYDSTFTAVDANVGDCTNDFSTLAVNNQFGCNFGNTTASNFFGRFIPDHLDVSLNTPQLTPACSTFTYMGQPVKFATNPIATVSAKNSAGSVTQNYTGSYFKINTSNISNATYNDISQSVSVLNGYNLAIADLGQTLGGTNFGLGTLTFSDTSYNALAITRPSNPIAQYNANIALSFNLLDIDNVAVANINGTSINNSTSKISFGANTLGNGISFTGGNNAMLWGRLAMGNAHGSELSPLVIPVSAQYFNGINFVANSMDNCTSLSLSNQIYLSNGTSNGGAYQSATTAISLGTGSTNASLLGSTLLSGSGGISFSAPGAGNTGAISVQSNISNSLPWLLYPWNQSNSQNALSPSALVTFGVYQGNSKVIYFREVY